MKIFLADDDEDDRISFVDALTEIPLDTQITQFTNGVELMDRLYADDKLPDVIFLDLKMPMMDGFECLEDIRNVDKLLNIPVVIYSTSFHKKEVETLKETGATRYLKKPSSFNQLKTMLYDCLNNLQEFSYADNNKPDDKNFIIDP